MDVLKIFTVLASSLMNRKESDKMKVMHFYSYLTFHECYKYCSVSTYRPRNQKKILNA